MEPRDWRRKSGQLIGSSEFGECGRKRRIGGGQVGDGDGDGGVDDDGRRESKEVEIEGCERGEKV